MVWYIQPNNLLCRPLLQSLLIEIMRQYTLDITEERSLEYINYGVVLNKFIKRTLYHKVVRPLKKISPRGSRK